jgi:ubiquinone/menaquinone biosynthesis C-methylase UbiE
MRENDFDQVLADEYKLLHFAYTHHDEFQKTVAQTIVKYFSGSKQEEIKVIEGGSGSGVSTSFLLKADPRIKVCAVDSSAKMLEQAKQTLMEDSSRVIFQLDDLLSYLQKQEDSSFDVFVAVWTIHNLQPEYRKDLFCEIFRILKPNGLFVSGDKYSVDDEVLHESQLKAQLNRFKEFGITDNVTLADDWVKHNLEDEKIRITEKEQIGMLEAISFSNIEVVYRKDMEAVIKAVKKNN